MIDMISMSSQSIFSFHLPSFKKKKGRDANDYLKREIVCCTPLFSWINIETWLIHMKNDPKKFPLPLIDF
jgi:hypothetical protein